jgi:hypothetical protein
MSLQSEKTHNLAILKHVWESQEKCHFNVTFVKMEDSGDSLNKFKVWWVLWMQTYSWFIYASIWFHFKCTIWFLSFDLWIFLCLWIQLWELVVIPSQSFHIPFLFQCEKLEDVLETYANLLQCITHWKFYFNNLWQAFGGVSNTFVYSFVWVISDNMTITQGT